MTTHPGSDPSLPLRLIARIAGLLAHPSALVHPSHFEMLGGKRLRDIAARPEFAPWLDGAIARSLGLHGYEFPAELPERLAAHAESRAAALLAAAPLQELELAAQLLAAAIQHKRLSALVARSDRAEAGRQLGRMPFQVAIREAFALYAELAALAPADPPPLGPPPLGPSQPEAVEAPPPLARPGYCCLYAFVRQVEPGLQPLLAWRMPRGFDPGDERVPLDGRLRGQILSLLRRKMPGWVECIA